MDLRPQAHEIIRTWLFTSVVRAHYELDIVALVERGYFRLHRRPRSKEAVEVGREPAGRSDDTYRPPRRRRLRYWAAQGRPGLDMAFEEGQMKIGRRLATKLLNASRFALNLGPDPRDANSATMPTSPLDRALLAGLAGLVDEATASFEQFDYARALERTESFFWPFCDDYLELVKNRAYGTAG